jgi:fibronectin-binding autotransporter adhesin
VFRNSVRSALLRKQVSWATAAVLVQAAVGLCSSTAHGQVVYYYPGSGVLQLNDSGSNYFANLGSILVYVANTSYLPSGGTVMNLSSSSNWTWQVQSAGGSGGDYMDWSYTYPSDTPLPQGVYTMAQLPAGLSALAFGYSYSQVHPPESFNYGVGDTSSGAVGAMEYGSVLGGSTTGSIVTTKRSVPSENDWIGPVNGSWNTASNWSLGHSASASETASFVTASLAGTVTLDRNQSAGSLWFDSSSPYTIASGSGAFTLSLSNTASIWIDSGLHTISAPLALSGSLTVDAEPAGNVAPTSTGLIISGPISGGSSLAKIGPGILYMSNANNSYNGGTSITGGTLSAAAAGSLGAGGSVTIADATLDFSASGSFAQGISLSGSGTNVIQPDAGVMTLSGAVSGSGGLTKAGNGTLALSNGGNLYSGGTSVAAGILRLQAVTALGSTSPVTVAGGAELDLDGTSPTMANISGSGTVTNSALSTTSTLSAAYVGGTASFAAAIQDGAGHIALSVPSGGLLTLGNTANTFSRGVSVSGGTLGISADGNLGGPASGVALNNGTLLLGGSTSFTLGSGRAISLAGNSSIDVVAGQSATIAGTLSGGTLTKTDGGMLYLTGSNTYGGGTVVNGGTLAAAFDSSLGASGAGITINNATLQLASGTSNRNLLLGSGFPALSVASGALTEAGLVSGGSNALTKTGPGTLALTNASNNFSGILLQAGGLLNNDATGDSLAGGNGQVVVTGGTLMGSGTFVQPVTVMAGGDIMAGDASTMGVMTLQNGLNLVQGASAATWTLKIDAYGDSDSLNFGTVTGANSTLNISGSATLLVTGAPLPSTTTPYTIITNAQAASPTQTNPVDAANLIVQAPLGFTGSVYQSSAYYFNPNFPNGLFAYSLSFTSATAWIVSGTGNWSTNSNWSDNVPLFNNSPLAGCTAIFGAAGSGTVVLPGSGTTTYVNTLVFANSSSSYTLSPGAGGSTLSFLRDSTGQSGGAIDQGGAFVEVVYGRDTIAVPSRLNCDLNVSTLDPAAAMTFSGALSGTGSLTATGSGRLILSGSNTYSGGTNVEGGILIVENSDSLLDGSSLVVGEGASSLFGSSLASPVVPSIVSPVPEPGTVAILAVGAICCLAARKSRRFRVWKRLQ